jgi:hypothetical protein
MYLLKNVRYVVSGLTAQFLLLTGSGPYTDDANYSEAEKTTRGYCRLLLITLAPALSICVAIIVSIYCIFPGILVLMDFVLLSGLLVYAFGSKITPPKNKEVVISKVEVQGCCGLLYAVFSMPFDVLGSITYQPSQSDALGQVEIEKSPNRVI